MRHWHRQWPGRILDVRYEDLVGHPEQQARRVLDYLALPLLEGPADIIANTKAATATGARQLKQPIHARNIAGWRRYQQRLAPLQALLSDCIGDYEAETADIRPSTLRVPVHT